MLMAAAASDPLYAELPMKIAILDNKIVKGNYKLAKNIPIDISNS